ncbi:cell division protein FtsX [Thermosyntropha lipolytica DSM 11003]|uniref:Cell division protein FtsX n=1 Tax=Thermosyntropha lipolytica DSM 11003 TaxID=1123382 RepID=A0A1M5KLQ7_9FIRM|nr:permease-like cell division protein FtsX [Thermosyntropha lipolytica]SHG53744.1 cell division protein FtsX [Thermosyntropha lipolytica DSM 11003]
MRNIAYFWREAWRSLSRNRLLTLATVSTVCICVLILGVALLLTVNAGNFMKHLESDVEIVAFVDKSLTPSQVKAIGKELTAIPGIDKVKFVSREEGLKKLQQKMGMEKLEETIGENPLPDTYEIKASDPREVPHLARKIEKIEGIYKVKYGQGVVEKLFQVTRWIRIVSMAVIILLALGAVFLIATTIRLAIYSRRKEIYLMKLIGATDWFIRWPFFIEGFILGTLGALVAVAILALAYNSLISNMQTVFFLPLVAKAEVVNRIYLGLIGVGSLLGIVGTYISVNRFLKV